MIMMIIIIIVLIMLKYLKHKVGGGSDSARNSTAHTDFPGLF